jgi:hypothetical protein
MKMFVDNSAINYQVADQRDAGPYRARVRMGVQFAIMLVIVAVTLTSLPARAEDAPEPELSSDYLSLVMRYLYRWYLDETALLVIDDSDEVEFLMRWLKPELDEGDKSSYIELLVPQLSFAVVLKKADYVVPEMDIEIKNADYRIIRAGKYDQMPAERDAYRSVKLDKKNMLEFLFSVRNQRDFPDGELIERMREALRNQYGSLTNIVIEGPQTIYVAPISKVSNNLWVFWENARQIIRFSSDSDIASKAFWAYEKLGVEMYDLEKDVVVSVAETPGSNAYVTRDWAARVLYNCVVFGQRQTLTPKAAVTETKE